MERDKKKRAREEAEDKKDFVAKTAKKQQDLYHHRNYNYDNISFSQAVEAQDESESNNNISSSSSSSSDNNYLRGLGVFDFPWLHNDDGGYGYGVISNKSEEWNFQDTFSSSLDDPTCSNELLSSHVEFSRQCQYESETTTTITSMINFRDINKFEENVLPFFKGDKEDDSQLEIGTVDCIWSSMINQPLQ